MRAALLGGTSLAAIVLYWLAAAGLRDREARRLARARRHVVRLSGREYGEAIAGRLHVTLASYVGRPIEPGEFLDLYREAAPRATTPPVVARVIRVEPTGWLGQLRVAFEVLP